MDLLILILDFINWQLNIQKKQQKYINSVIIFIYFNFIIFIIFIIILVNMDVNLALSLLDLGDINRKMKMYKTAYLNYEESL